MCEWLSAREWCDVQLQCGGRSLGAHRAVLASVSFFLRRLLLSCPAEDTPTCILLPDFDFEAMSLVLYYIYKGEVVLQKEKLEMFMEIVKAMQIFVDKQYLPTASIGVEGVSELLSNQLERGSVFTLGNNNGPIITLKKGVNIQHVFGKDYNEPDILNTRERFEDWSKQLCFGNVQSTHGDRQRSFFLRDLYIETYPQNGNANGRTTSVPAIPNECYRSPASVLLTNANGKHLGADDSHRHTDVQHKPTDLPKNIQPLHQRYCTGNIFISSDDSLMNCPDLAQMKNFTAEFSSSNPKMLTTSYLRSGLGSLSLDHLLTQQRSQIYTSSIQGLPEKPSLDLSSTQLIPSVKMSFSNFYNDSSKLREKRLNEIGESNKTANLASVNVLSRSTILNQVLKSPWCPRQPNNYRPFRRKTQNATTVLSKNAKESPVNDNNNNIETPEVTDRISSTAAAEPYSIPTLASGTEFKCAICNQVFADAEGLELHTRRHASPARYSCPECSKSFSQLRNFKYHMSVHRGTREFAATCTVCGKYFNDRGYLSSHMKIHRNRKEYKCSQCPKSFNQRVAYNMHVRIHTGIKPHVCGECGKAFSRKMLLKQHQRTHSGERPYACPHCDKRFADRSNMTLHLRLHSGIKPFSCTLCPKSFTKKHHLKSHLNFHTGAKPYSCPRCKLAFTQSSNMRTHLKKCTAPDPTNNAENVTSS